MKVLNLIYKENSEILLSIFRDGWDVIFYFSGRAGWDKNFSFDLIQQFSGRRFLLEFWI
jgi:hypothetical protein